MAREIFKNLPDTSTPINASKLNGIFNGEESMGSIVVEDINFKNLLALNDFQTQTLNGLTATKNNDGSITINGTATANTFFTLNSGLDFEENETYTLSGCPTGGNYANKYSLYIDINNTEKEEKAKDEGNGTTFTPTATTGKAYIVVRKGQTLSNAIFKPQLELGNKKSSFVKGKDFKNADLKTTTKEYADYITFVNDVTVNSCFVEKLNNIIYIHALVNYSFIAGTNTIANLNKPLKCGGFGSGRVNSGSQQYPATVTSTSNGQIRMYSTVTGTDGGFTIMLILDEETN